MKNPRKVFVEIDKLILTCIGKGKETRNADTVFKRRKKGGGGAPARWPGVQGDLKSPFHPKAKDRTKT